MVRGCYEKIKNPLIRRIPKELIGDWKKYLVVFLFLVLTIGFVSGMYVANESMITSANEGVTKYKQEDGHFELKNRQMPPCFRQLRPVKKRMSNSIIWMKQKETG